MNATGTVVNRATPVDSLPELLTADEVAAWLGVSPWSAYDMARRGVLPVVRLGRLVRIQRTGLERLAGRPLIKTEKVESP
jgi:excisionase family DNA binding protein